MIIRKATIKDLKEIQELCAALIKKEHKDYDKLLNLKWSFEKSGKDYFKDCITKPNAYALVAVDEENEAVVGYLTGEVIEGEEYRTLPKTGELASFYIMKKYQGEKIGTKMYKEFVKWFKKKGVKLIKVEASTGNFEGLGFYKRQGFKDYSVILEKGI